VSAPLQNTPSSQAEPAGSAAVQVLAFSSQDSAQSWSWSAPGQGLPACALHEPEAQESEPLQNTPSSQGEPWGSAPLQESAASLQLSLQFASPSTPGHGLPAWTAHAPDAQVSAPLQ
jgi:hypothetical protein